MRQHRERDRGMRMIRSIVLASFVAISAALLAPTTTLARLDPSMPSTAELQRPPDANLVLTFPGDIDVAGAEIKIVDEHSNVVPIERPQLSNDKTAVNVPLKAPLPPGVYTVKWRGKTMDGRRRKGSYRFHVDP
jgi:methionine-rich copper-binding protein CopC